MPQELQHIPLPTKTHHIADPHHTGTSPKMIVDLEHINPTSTITNPHKDHLPVHNQHTGSLRIEGTNRSQLMIHPQNITLHLWIAEFKFTRNFIICDQLPETELIFSIDIQKKFSLSYTWDKEKNCYIQRNGNFLVYTHPCNHMATIGTVKSTVKIPPRHNGVIPIKISGPIIKTLWYTSLQMTVLPKERIQTLT